jgi:uncharacterized protein
MEPCVRAHGRARGVMSWLFGSLLAVLTPSEAARADSACPFGMWPSEGSCCDVGSEYVPAKQQCMPVRPERRCVQGHLDDCVGAARALEIRSNVGAGYALELYRYACDEGYAPGCRGLGSLYERGAAVARDPKRAVTLWETACAHGDAPSCTLVARALVRDGSGDGRVMPLLVMGCHRGDAEACTEYAERLGRDPSQHARAENYLERACSGGAGRACRMLLEQERRDETLVRARERELLERGCSAGEPHSCGELADSIVRGAPGQTSLTLAAAHYRTACDGGSAESCVRLAELTMDGQGVARDVGRASELYARACGAGLVLACERKHSLDGALPPARGGVVPRTVSKAR